MRMTRGLRRTRTPTVPMAKSTPPSSKTQEASSCDPPISSVLISPGSRNHGAASDFVGSSQVVDLFAAEVDRADRRDQQEDRGQLERIEIRGEESDRDRLHGPEGGDVGSLVALPELYSL